MNVNFEEIEKAWFKPKKETRERIYKNTIKYINFLINHYKEQLKTPIEDTYFASDVNRKGYITSIISYLEVLLLELNKDYESKDVLDELEKYLENEIKEYKKDGYDISEIRHEHLWLAGCYDEDKYILNKIQELKNEVK